MKTTITLIFSIYFSIICNGQIIEFKKDIKIDTLYLYLNQTDTTDIKLNKEIQLQFDSLVQNYNIHNNSFKIKIDSSKKHNALTFTMGQINYVTLKRRLLISGLDLTLLGLNILILPFPPIIPFYLMPATNSKITIENKSGILKQNSKLFINPNGYFSKMDKQKIKFKKKFNKRISNFFNEINKQYTKNQ